ncbi:MAG: FKBP-type peptidyl-prolyl cis-trans isomerase [Verrucomicrobiota bacterium]
MKQNCSITLKTISTILLSAATSLVATAEDAAPESAAADLGAIKTFGWMVAQQSVIPMEFNAEELAAFEAGFEEGSTEAGDIESMQAELQAMSLYLQSRMEGIQARLAAEQAGVNDAYFAELMQNPDIQKTESGLCYTIIEAGEEMRASATDSVLVHYRGTLTDGTVFDSSYERGEPAEFPVSQVVPGFSEGVQLVGKGGKAKLYIPSDLGYGEQVRPGGPIPANAVLVFDIEMIDIIKTAAAE